MEGSDRGPDVFEITEDTVIVIEGAQWTSADAKSIFDALLRRIENHTDQVMQGSRYATPQDLMRRKARAYEETLHARKEALLIFEKCAVPARILKKEQR